MNSSTVKCLARSLSSGIMIRGSGHSDQCSQTLTKIPGPQASQQHSEENVTPDPSLEAHASRDGHILGPLALERTAGLFSPLTEVGEQSSREKCSGQTDAVANGQDETPVQSSPFTKLHLVGRLQNSKGGREGLA